MSHTQAIAEQSKAFLEAFDTLNKSMYQKIQIGTMYGRVPIFERFPIIAPAIACLAFAAEIAIKALIVHSAGGNLTACPRGHNLDELFEMIPHSLRQAIAQTLQMPPADVEGRLKKEAKAFEQWRYSYENGAIADEVFLRTFVQAVLAQIPD